MMKLSCIAASAMLTALSLGSLSAAAQSKAADPDFSISYNVGVVSDYRYRGISQSSLKPTLQGGADFAHKNGFYLGAWGSGIDWIHDDGITAGSNTGQTKIELDLYGGYKGKIGAVGYDIGLLQYVYPSNRYARIAGAANANTTELYGALTLDWFSAKYSHSLSNTFGFGHSKGSYYVNLSANLDLGKGLSFVPHVGYQSINNANAYSYTDYALTLTQDLGNGLSASLSYIDTDSNAYLSSQGKNKGKSALVLGVKYGF